MTFKKKIALLGAIGLSAISLVSCDTSNMSEKIEDTATNMLPNIWITITQLIVVTATACLVIFLAYKPMKKKLKQRADYIEKNIKDSEDKENKAQENLDKSNQIILGAQEKAGVIIQQAQKTAEVKAAEVQKQLSASIEAQKLQAHKDIEAEHARMIKNAHDQIVATAIDASKQILKREINEKDNQTMVNDFIANLNVNSNSSDSNK